MQVKELKKEELSREYGFTIPGSEIFSKVNSSIAEQGKTFKLTGFREGKVPLSIVKKHIGQEVLSKTIEGAVSKALGDFFTEKNIRPAFTPSIDITEFGEDKDLQFTARFEIFPEIPDVDWKALKVTTFSLKVTEDDLKKGFDNVIANFKDHTKAEDGYAATNEDAMIINFIGRIDGKEFDGGKADGLRVELSHNTFLPEFQKGLLGAVVGEKKEISVTFPGNYGAKDLASKTAIFEIEVLEIQKPVALTEVNDEFLKKVGIESKEKFRELITEKLKFDFGLMSRMKVKKQLFDDLDKLITIDLPKQMVDMDINVMLNEVTNRARHNNGEVPNQDAFRKEYLPMAQRRVKLGLMLAEVARKNGIEILEQDLQNAIRLEMMQRPGQEKQVLDFFSKPEHLESLKGPVLEEKAVDFIISQADTQDQEITLDEFNKKYAAELGAA